MKVFKLLAAAAMVLAIGSTASAQIRFDAQVGWSVPQGKYFDDAAKGGLCYSLDLMYAPSFLNGQLSFGIAKDGNLLFGAKKGADWGMGSADVEYSASKLGLVGGKVRFDLKAPIVKPYAAITLGAGRLKLGDVKSASASFNLGGISLGAKGDDSFEYDPVTAFAVKPELGVALGWFTFGVGWMLPTDYEVTEFTGEKVKYHAGTTQFNIGVAFKFGD